MADKLTTEVILTGDASQLTHTFDELVNAITETREQLKEYKNDKEKQAELTQKLAEQEEKLIKLMAENKNVVDSSKVSYRQLNDILKDINKTYRNTADASKRLNIAPASKAINNELKRMDAEIGNYQRNVGNYAGDIDKAFQQVQYNTSQVLRELPSLKYGFEQFFLAISNNIPMLIDSIKRFRDLSKARGMATGAATESAVAHNSETTNTSQAAAAHNAETEALGASTDAHIKEAEAAVRDAEAELKNAIASRDAAKAIYENKAALEERLKTEINELKIQLAYNKNLTEQEFLLQTLKQRQGELGSAVRERRLAEKELTKQTELLNKAQSELATKQNELEKVTRKTAGGAFKGILKGLFSWQTMIMAVVIAMTLWGKEIIKWFSDLGLFGKSVKSVDKIMKDYNNTLKESKTNAAQNVVELHLYNNWAQMVTKSEKERNLAAKRTLEIMGSSITQTNIAMVKNGQFADSINEVTNALIRQAQAEALSTKITEKYKTVIEAMDKLADAESGKLDFLGVVNLAGQSMAGMERMEGNSQYTFDISEARELAQEDAVNRAKEGVRIANEEFKTWLDTFLENFNPSDLLGLGGGNGGDGDKWFSKWELYIKGFEAQLVNLQGTYERLDLGSIWKYSEEGYESYMKMYDEYIEHYSDDEKQLKEYEAKRTQYENDYLDYHSKLQQQYIDSTKTEYEVEMNKLEEWYMVQVKIYENAGEDTTALFAEYTKRKEAILDKYVDKYKNAALETQAIDASGASYYQAMQDLELQNLQDTMDKEIKEYERKGIDTTNLEEHYAAERLKIISKYADEETNAILDNIKKQEDALTRQNETLTRSRNLGGATELFYNRIGGTTMTGHQKRQNEIAGKQDEMNIYMDSSQKQIEAMQAVLDSGKLIGEERLEMETQLSDAIMEQALRRAEYQVELDEMVSDDATQTYEEITETMTTAFQGLGQAFSDVYSAIESNIEAEVKAGKISEEEGEKRMEEYRGLQAAAAMMDALASSVAAYKSLAGIPIVGPGLGVAAAAAALAAGIASVKQIMTVDKNNVTATNSYANAAPSLNEYVPAAVTNITGRDDTDYLRNSLNEKPIRAFVVESEATAAQEVAAKRTEETTF